MVNPELPDDILLRLVEMVAEDDYGHLGLFIRAGKRSHRLVFQSSVLRRCNLNPMIWNDYRDLLVGGRGRIFWEKCLQHHNPQAVYVEALRIAIFEEELYPAIYLLQSIVPSHPQATLASAIFCVCLGETDQASQIFQEFIANHGLLHEANARIIGDTLKADIAWLDPPYGGSHAYSFLYPDDDFIEKLECVSGDCWYPGYYCMMCYMYWCATSVCHMLP